MIIYQTTKKTIDLPEMKEKAFCIVWTQYNTSQYNANGISYTRNI